MPQNILQTAAGLLAQHYGQSPETPPPGEWLTLVRVVLDRARSSRKPRPWSWIAETPLRTAAETAALHETRLAEILEAAGWRAKHAAPLPALAQWWLRRIGDGEAVEIFQGRPLATWQQELRALRGVNWELADRILLVVCDFPVYPLDRGSLRIAARHAWMEMTAEYDDGQAFFVGGLRDSAVDISQFAAWNSRAGRDFCGTRPRCEDCPLKALLPARGPVPLVDE